MNALRRRMLEDLQLRGLAPKTQQCYLDAVKHLAYHYRRAPDQITRWSTGIRMRSIARFLGA